MLRGRNVVCVSTISWDFLWQGHQAISTILARAGNRVLFIETTGVRAPAWRDRARVIERLSKWLGGRGRFAAIEPNLFLYSPLALPFPYSPLAQRLNRLWTGSAIARWASANDFHDPVLLSFLPTQFTLDLIDVFEPAVTVFCCTDKLAQTSPEAAQLVPYEKQVLERSDLVFASAEKLVEHCRRYNPATHFLSTGVSLEKFDRAWSGDGERPADVRDLPRPLIGSVGGRRKCVDQRLLSEVIRAMPQATFAFVGPEQTSVGDWRALANVELLGTKPHEAIPAYVREFDVCLVPYVVDEFTDHISPAKLNEYLALGKPVVATGLHEIRRFVETHGDVVTIANGRDEFVAAIEAALAGDSTAMRTKRRAVAESHAWALKVETMSLRIEQSLADRARRSHSR